MVNISDKLRNRILFLVVLIILSNVVISLAPQLLPPVEFNLNNQNEQDVIYEGSYDKPFALKSSNNYVYMMTTEDYLVHVYNQKGELSWELNISEYLPLGPFIFTDFPIFMTNADDQGFSILYYIILDAIEYHFAYFTTTGLNYDIILFSMDVPPLTNLNLSPILTPQTHNFEEKQVVSLVIVFQLGLNLISRYEIIEVDREGNFDALLDRSLKNSDGSVGVIFDSILIDNQLIVSGLDISNGDEDITKYVFDLNSHDFQPYEAFVNFKNKQMEKFQNQEDTYGYYGTFFVNNEIRIIAFWNDKLLFPSEPPVRYLDIINENDQVVHREDLYQFLGNNSYPIGQRPSIGFVNTLRMSNTNYVFSLSSSYEYLALQTVKLGKNGYIFGFNDAENERIKNRLLVYDTDESTITNYPIYQNISDWTSYEIRAFTRVGDNLFAIVSGTLDTIQNVCRLIMSTITAVNFSAKFQSWSTLVKYLPINLLLLTSLIGVLMIEAKTRDYELYPKSE